MRYIHQCASEIMDSVSDRGLDSAGGRDSFQALSWALRFPGRRAHSLTLFGSHPEGQTENKPIISMSWVRAGPKMTKIGAEVRDQGSPEWAGVTGACPHLEQYESQCPHPTCASLGTSLTGVCPCVWEGKIIPSGPWWPHILLSPVHRWQSIPEMLSPSDIKGTACLH